MADRHEPTELDGDALSTVLSKENYMKLMPKIIEVNGLIKDTRAEALRDVSESSEVMEKVIALFRAKIGLTYRVEKKFILPPAKA